nr:ATP-binding protein [Niveibacterium umoris]
MAVAQVRDTPWRVVVFTPEAAWRAGFDAELRTILLLGGITTLLLLVASWWVAGRISGPIVRLTEVADRIGRDAAQPELPVDADGEVGRLARALQSMMRRLDEARATLAQQVEEQRATALRLQISESRLTALFNLSPLPLLLSDRESGEVMDVNAAFVTQFGAVAASLAGASLASLSGDARFPSFYTLARQLQLQGDVDQVVPVRHDGEASFMRTFGRAFEAGARKLAIWTCVDVTETENARRALEELNASLEGRVEQRTNALRETLQHLQLAQDELVRSEKLAALGSLVAGVAHELNTPLGNSVTVASTIGELTSRLAEDLAGGRLRRSQLDEFVVAMQSAADLITRNLARARTLVTSFKQVSVDRVSEGRRRFDLAEVINEVAATLAPGLKGQPGRLDLDLAPVEMDSFPGAIGQIITNLVNNAMLHAFEGRDDGLVVLSCRHLPDGFAELVCRDDGSGMDAETLRRIFDPFFTTKFGRGGSGLGMHIVYNLVTRGLGGTIEVASQPGSGARFRIVMPCVAPAHAD